MEQFQAKRNPVSSEWREDFSHRVVRAIRFKSMSP